MLDYSFVINTYEEVLKKRGDDENVVVCIGEKLAAMRLLNGRSEEEVNALFDTGAFNDIVRGYLSLVLRGCEQEKLIPAAMDELAYLFDTVSACEARKAWISDGERV